MRQVRAFLVAAAVPMVGFAAFGQAPLPPVGRVSTACRALVLRSPQSPATASTTAEIVAAGAFTPPGQRGGAAFSSLPAFCRIALTLAPSTDSDIKVEVWLPAEGWNGKFQGVGNGAFNGTIAYPAMASALASGYAVASTDTGHEGNTGEFGLGHPEKVIDFGWRAVHEMTVVSKELITAFYGTAPTLSYWTGCSAGGRQAMKEAQRFPNDFDGIVAGAPGLDWTGRAAQAVHVARALDANDAARLPEAKRELLHRAVLAACDARDGVEDGVVGNPEQCAFDPGTLQCASGDAASCLTTAQVATARMLYTPLVNARTGRSITALARGSELGWTDLGWTASARATGLDQFRYLLFADPSWDVDRFSFDTDLARAEQADADTINALNPDLSAFIAGGGKLIQYHGWADPQISPFNSTQYYQRVVDAAGGRDRVNGAYRLFMAPGMGHCRGGEGPDTFDTVAALEAWVERGEAPDRIVASKVERGAVVQTRPLCPYPQVARYTGTGSTDEASSFVCAMP
jgi:feruloyl esterase